MSASSPVNITELIDRYPLGTSQIKIIVLCGLVALFDGFDLLASAVARPAMAGPLHVAPRQFGFILSAALSGLNNLNNLDKNYGNSDKNGEDRYSPWFIRLDYAGEVNGGSA